MGWKWSENTNTDGSLVASWDTNILGVDRDSGATKLREGYVEYTENMRLRSGTPVGVYGYSLLDTTMDADDNATPAGFGQYSSGGTEEYIIIQADGKAQVWNAAGNSWTQLFTGLTVSNDWNEINYLGYLIWVNPDNYGNYYYDGSNFLPLGARMLSDCESDQDGQWANETAEATIVKEGVQSYSTGAIGAGGNITLTFTPTTNIDLTTALDSATAYSGTNASFGFWIYVTDASEVDEAASMLTLTDGSATTLTIAMSSWIDKATGTTLVLSDATWHQIEIPYSSMTDSGTFDYTDLDTVAFYFEEDGGSGYTGYIDSVYEIYSTQMPGCQTVAVWNDVLLAAGATATNQDPSDVHFTPVNAPHEYDALAFISVNPDAGGSVTALKRFFNQVFIGKENSCHSLGGTTAGTLYPNFNYEVIDVSDEHGVDGHRSIVEANRRLYFPWKTQYRYYDGTGTRDISELVRADLFDHEEQSLNQKTSVYYHRENEIWLAYPGNGDTHNARFGKILPGEEREDNTWLGVQDSATALNLNLMKIVYESGQEKIVGIDENGDIMWLDDSNATDFNGTTITRTVRFPWLGGSWMWWKEIHVRCDAQSSGSITVQYAVALHPREMTSAAFTTAGTVALSATQNYGRVFLGDISRWIQIQFTASATFFDIQWPLEIFAVPTGRT